MVDPCSLNMSTIVINHSFKTVIHNIDRFAILESICLIDMVFRDILLVSLIWGNVAIYRQFMYIQYSSNH